MPLLLLGARLLERLETLGWQASLDLVADGAETAEGRQRVRPEVCAERALWGVVIRDGSDACGRGLKVGIRDQEVARDAGVGRRKDLRPNSPLIGGGRRDLLYARLRGLHNAGILDKIGVDVIHSLVVPSTNGIYLRVEVTVKKRVSVDQRVLRKG